MRILLAQINPTVGALQENARKAIDAIAVGRERGAELVVFPELALTGYPPRDLLDRPDFIRANLRWLEEIAAATEAPDSPGVIIGYVEPRREATGRDIYNAAALIERGEIISRHYKTLLPTYDVFDEGRYFEPAASVRPAKFRGATLGITICEDFWNDELLWPRRRYHLDPVERLARNQPDLMINISASPFAVGKPKIRADMFHMATSRHRIPLVHVNMVGGNDALIFDGRSCVWSADGGLVEELPAFVESLRVIEAGPQSVGDEKRRQPGEAEEICEALKLGVRDYVAKCGFERVLVGLSGGVDSALTAALAAEALGSKAVVGVSMPSEFSSSHSITDAAELAQNLEIEHHIIPIQPMFQSFLGGLQIMFDNTPFGLAEENLQARIRGSILMTISNKYGWLTLNTGNKSELATGYCTLYGDMCGGLAVIADVLKTKVYAVSKWINRNGPIIPVSTLQKPPSAELRPDQLDTDSLPPYETLDPIIEAYVEKLLSPEEIVALGHDEETTRRVARLIDFSEYKRRQSPIVLKVTERAFGEGRRMPVARGRY